MINFEKTAFRITAASVLSKLALTSLVSRHQLKLACKVWFEITPVFAAFSYMLYGNCLCFYNELISNLIGKQRNLIHFIH